MSMASYKEKLSEHCDKVAFGIVAVSVAAILALGAMRADPVDAYRSRITAAISTLERNAQTQKLTVRPEPVADALGTLRREVETTGVAQAPWTPFGMYWQPAILRGYSGEAVRFPTHEAPVITRVAVERDVEVRAAVIIVTWKPGLLARAELVQVKVRRRETGMQAWRDVGEIAVGEIQGADVGAVLTFKDAQVQPGTAYQYQIECRARKQETYRAEQWAPGSSEIQSSGPAPPDDAVAQTLVPRDVRIMFVQGAQASISGRGSAFFNVEYHDYDAGGLRNVRMERRDEQLGRSRDQPPKDEDLLPGTRLFLLMVREDKDTGRLRVVLRHADRAGVSMELAQGAWEPEHIACPPPWEASAAAPRPGAAEDDGTFVPPPEGDEEFAPPLEGDEEFAPPPESDEEPVEENPF